MTSPSVTTTTGGNDRDVGFRRHFFFLALLNAGDRKYHATARTVNRIDRPVLTSAWVLIELGDHLCDERNRHLYGRVLDAIRSDPRYTIVPPDAVTLEEATQLYRQRQDKKWSLTDCTSFVLMKRHGITDALTADHHFTQAGFNALLAIKPG